MWKKIRICFAFYLKFAKQLINKYQNHETIIDSYIYSLSNSHSFYFTFSYYFLTLFSLSSFHSILSLYYFYPLFYPLSDSLISLSQSNFSIYIVTLLSRITLRHYFSLCLFAILSLYSFSLYFSHTSLNFLSPIFMYIFSHFTFSLFSTFSPYFFTPLSLFTFSMNFSL